MKQINVEKIAAHLRRWAAGFCTTALAFSPHDSRSNALAVFQQAFPAADQAVEVGRVIQVP